MWDKDKPVWVESSYSRHFNYSLCYEADIACEEDVCVECEACFSELFIAMKGGLLLKDLTFRIQGIPMPKDDILKWTKMNADFYGLEISCSEIDSYADVSDTDDGPAYEWSLWGRDLDVFQTIIITSSLRAVHEFPHWAANGLDHGIPFAMVAQQIDGHNCSPFYCQNDAIRWACHLSSPEWDQKYRDVFDMEHDGRKPQAFYQYKEWTGFTQQSEQSTAKLYLPTNLKEYTHDR